MNSCIVFASQSDEESTPIDSPFGAASSSEKGSTSRYKSISALRSAQSYGVKAATASGSLEYEATKLEGHDKQASFNEVTSSESTPAPRPDDLASIENEQILWCVEGQY